MGVFLKKRVACQNRNGTRILKGLDPGFGKDWNQKLEGCQNHSSVFMSFAYAFHCIPAPFFSLQTTRALRSPGYYAEGTPSSQVCMCLSAPGGRFTQSIYLYLLFSFCPLLFFHSFPTPETSKSHLSLLMSKFLGKGLWSSYSPSLVQSTVARKTGSCCTYMAIKSLILEFQRVVYGRKYREGGEAKNGILFAWLDPARSCP